MHFTKNSICYPLFFFPFSLNIENQKSIKRNIRVTEHPRSLTPGKDIAMAIRHITVRFLN